MEITVQTPGGGDMVVDYRKEGQFFGGTPIFTGEPYTGGARTLKPTVCYLIPEEILRRLQRDYPQIGGYFTRMVLSRVRELYSEIVHDHGQKALTQMEAYPFKKRLSEIMVAPVECCRPEESAQQVARRLTEKKIGSVLVTDESGKVLGIITGKDLVAKVIAPEHADPPQNDRPGYHEPTPLQPGTRHLHVRGDGLHDRPSPQAPAGGRPAANRSAWSACATCCATAARRRCCCSATSARKERSRGWPQSAGKSPPSPAPSSRRPAAPPR